MRTTLVTTTLTLILLTGCASEELPRPKASLTSQTTSQTPVSKEDPALKSIPVRDRSPRVETRQPTEVIAAVTKPKVPSLGDVLKDKVLVSPYTSVSPIVGRWAWVPDATFILVLSSEGQMIYGPTQAGFYQMLSPESIRFQITQVNGVSVGGTSPQDWQVSFFENNNVLLLSRGAQAMPFKRVE